MRNSIRDDALPWAALSTEGLAFSIGWSWHCWRCGESIRRGIVEIFDRKCDVSPRDVPSCARGKICLEKRQAAREGYRKIGCLFRAKDNGEQKDCRCYKVN